MFNPLNSDKIINIYLLVIENNNVIFTGGYNLHNRI